VQIPVKYSDISQDEGKKQEATPYHKGFFIGLKPAETAHIPQERTLQFEQIKNIDEDE
jgi:hypothetical protein